MPPELAPLLSPGEELLWHDRPRPYVFILRGAPNFAYGITWGVLGAYWYRGAIMAGFQGWWAIVPWLSLPFILAGFSFWLYPIRLGFQANRTWYVITNRRIFIAELRKNKPPQLRIFVPEELASPEVVKRFDRPPLYDVILTHRAQKNPHLKPPLREGFFGLPDGQAAADAINTAASKPLNVPVQG